MLDSLLLAMDNVDIYYIYSNQCLNSIKFLGDKAFIIWDMHYWEIFYNYLLQVENCKMNRKNMTQGIIGVISDYLGEKYNKFYEISAFLKSIQSTYGIPIELSLDHCVSIKGKINICKMFSFYHEIGHLEYAKNNSDRILASKELVLELFDSLSRSDFEGLGIWSDLGWKTVGEIRNHKNDLVLEEITSDIFAIILVAEYYKSTQERSGFQLSCDIIVAIEYITTFQNLFNIINRAWDAHIAEMKYNLPVRRHKPDNTVNELEIARNGLGNLIITIVIENMFRLDKRQCSLLWKYRDENHVDNEDVISCLADEEFICIAIEEALK